MQLSRIQRELIGRTTLLLFFGLMPLWAGVKCIRTARWLDADFDRQHLNRPPTEKESSASFLPYLVGIVLLGIGSIFTFASIATPSFLQRTLGRPGNNILWTQGKVDPPLYRSGYID